MRNWITALVFATALSAAQAQPGDDAESTLDETVTDTSVEAAVKAAGDAQDVQDSQNAQAAANTRADAAAQAPEVVTEGDEKGDPVDVDPKAIEAAVRASINMSAPVEDGQIDVKATDDGTVTLAGSVASEAQKQLVETVASNSPAVRELRSEIVVREPGQLPPETPVDN